MISERDWKKFVLISWVSNTEPMKKTQNTQSSTKEFTMPPSPY